MVELDFKAFGLLPFIETECGSSINVSTMRRVKMDAQTLQYLKAMVSNNIESQLSRGSIFNAYQAF